jgi:hypothetical protein
MDKTCFKCGVPKPIDDFYEHPAMADGHLNKCKVCCRKDVKANTAKLLDTEGFIEKERARGREKYHRLYGIGNNKSNRASNNKWNSKFPEKRKANIAAGKIKLPFGYEKHHWSYRPEHVLDFIVLVRRGHGKAHRFIEYDQSEMMYRRIDTKELLDTKEKHEAFIRECILTKPD